MAEIVERGPWRVNSVGNVESDDFSHDVTLQISGDFEDRAQRFAYAKELCRRLNLTNPAMEKDAARWRWCVENPYETMMVLMEATNRDTFQLERRPSLGETRAYFIAGIDEAPQRGPVTHSPGYEPHSQGHGSEEKP